MAKVERTGGSPGMNATTAMVLLGACGAYITVVIPALVEQLVKSRGFDASAANYIIGAEKFGMMASSLVLVFTIERAKRTTLALSFLALLAVTNLACASIDSFVPYAATRFLCGVGEGGVISVMTAAAAGLGIADRVFGLYLATTLGIAWFAFQVAIPALLESMGLNGLFYGMGVLSTLIMLTVPFIPKAQSASAASDSARSDGNGASARKWIAMALGATALFEACIGAVWTNMTLIAGASGYSAEQIGAGMAWAMPVGMAGGLLASVLGDKLGRAIPLCVGVGVMLASQLCLQAAPGQVPFVLVAMGFFWAWMFTLPYFVGAVAALDTTGRAAVASIVVQTGGLMTGPILAGIVLTGNTEYRRVLSIGLITAIACLMLVLPAVSKKAVAQASEPAPA